MNRAAWLAVILLVTIVTGCAKTSSQVTATAAVGPSPTDLPANPLPTVSTSPDATEATSLPTVTASTVPTAAAAGPNTPPPEAHLNVSCAGIVPEWPSTLASAGILLLDSRDSDDTMLVDMTTRQQTLATQSNENRDDYAVSTDYTRVAYRAAFVDPVSRQMTDRKLVIADALRTILTTFPWDDGWVGIAGWLDQEQLVINAAGANPDEATAVKPATLVVLNTLTGQRRNMNPDFPNIYWDYPVPDWSDWGVTVYDTTLTRVVYAYDSFERHEAGYTLWDTMRKVALVNVPSNHLNHTPLWSPDATRFVVTANPDVAESWLAFELYGVDRDGQQTSQLTHLTAYYPKTYIQSYSWSPNGRFIAFWLVDDPMGAPFIEHGEAHLAVLDTETREVTNWCVPGEHDVSLRYPSVPAPLWSPDGRQIVVENSSAGGTSRLLMLDLETGIAAQIAENVEPVGWLIGDR